MAKDSDGAAINSDSIAFLDDVKRGKPRKFAMICKGISSVELHEVKRGQVYFPRVGERSYASSELK